MNRHAAHAGPYALGTFRAGGREFAGLVLGDRVHPIDDAAGLHLPSVRQLAAEGCSILYISHKLEEIRGEAKERINEAVRFADESEQPPIEELYTDVYAGEDEYLGEK